MEAVFKHPDSVPVLIADLSERLTTGETLASISQQPTIVAGDDGTLTFGMAAINPATVALPGGEADVPAAHGVQFTAIGGTSGGRYTIRFVVVTSDGETIAKDVELSVGSEF